MAGRSWELLCLQPGQVRVECNAAGEKRKRLRASGGSAGGVRQQNRAALELPLAMAANAMWELEADLEYRRGGHINLAEHEQQLAALDAHSKGKGSMSLWSLSLFLQLRWILLLIHCVATADGRLFVAQSRNLPYSSSSRIQVRPDVRIDEIGLVGRDRVLDCVP